MSIDPERTDAPTTPGAGRWILPIGLGLVGVAAAAVFLLKPDFGPPPADIAKDPFLSQGRTIYLSRCASCHGEKGRGDGPIRKGLTGPPPRDFVEDQWKHGDRPEQVLAVVSNGVTGTNMAGWKTSYSPEEIRAVTAYVYYLAGKPVPEVLRGK